MNKMNGYIEDRTSEIKAPGTASAGTSVFAAAADHVHPLGDKVLRVVEVPASKTATGKAGDIAFDATTLYICVADNTWKKVAIAWS